LALLLQDGIQEGRVDVETAIISNETLLRELFHEEVNSGSRCPYHFRQNLLRYSGNHLFGCVLAAIASEKQKSAGQPFLAGVQKLVVLSRPSVTIHDQYVDREEERGYVLVNEADRMRTPANRSVLVALKQYWQYERRVV
jgi:hypothetical protein